MLTATVNGYHQSTFFQLSMFNRRKKLKFGTTWGWV